MRRVAKVQAPKIPQPSESTKGPISEPLIKIGPISYGETSQIKAMAAEYASKHKHLTREDEVFLFRIYDRVKTHQKKLEKRLVKSGDGQRERIKAEIQHMKDAKSLIASVVVPANQGLAYQYARRAKMGKGAVHLSLEDLAQEASLGLQEKAMERFDYRKGYRFSTYATFWLRANINREIANNEKDVRVPVHITDAKEKLDKFIKAFIRSHNRLPESEEITKGTGFSMEMQDKLRAHFSSGGYAKTEDGVLSILDVIPQTTIKDPFRAVEELQDYNLVKKLMANLNPNEVLVITIRFELDGNDKRTLEDIGGELDLSRERIRQIERDALQKMGTEYRRLEMALKRQTNE